MLLDMYASSLKRRTYFGRWTTCPGFYAYVTLSPTVVASGTAIRIAAATSSNANTVTLRFGGQTVSLVQSAPGEWQIAFPFPASAVPIDGSSINAQLTASRSDGMTASIPIVLNSTP